MIESITLENKSLKGHPKKITVKTDVNGIPLEKFWRRRLKDAEIDNCVLIISYNEAKTKEPDVVPEQEPKVKLGKKKASKKKQS